MFWKSSRLALTLCATGFALVIAAFVFNVPFVMLAGVVLFIAAVLAAPDAF